MNPEPSSTAPPERRSRVIGGFAGLALAVLLGSCAATYDPPDLGDLYNRSAQYHGPERNPIILIPGLTGSTLADEGTGRIVWGAFTGDYANPSTTEGARLVALPMEAGQPLATLRDGVRADGVLDRVRLRLLGIPAEIRAYVNILAALGAGGFRDESLGIAGAVDYGSDHYTCFQFPYDWRRDNVENARRLQEFIVEKRDQVRAETLKRYGSAPERIRFDVVAHSMGGVLLRYFLRYGGTDLPDDGSAPPVTWAGARDVERAVLVGPPNGGAVDAFLQLIDGRDYGPFIPSYPPAVLGTFPSGYQLLPRARHGAVVRDSVDGEALDLFDPETWEAMGWGLADPRQGAVLARLLPGVPAEERRRIARDHLGKSLERARRVTEALDRPAAPPPSHLELYLVAGDAVRTEKIVVVDGMTGTAQVAARGPGDGTVLRSSALLDERIGGAWSPTLRSPVPWTDVLFLFSDHLGLTQDPGFTDNLLYWLLEDPRIR